GVTTTVNPALVSLGQAKPTLQVEVISRKVAPATTSEEALLETCHHATHLLADRVLRRVQPVPHGIVEPLSFCPTIRCRIQCRVHLSDRLDIGLYFLLCVENQRSSFVNASRQTLQEAFCVPPFLSRTLRCSDCCTSPNASTIRSPGGRKGPP